MAPVAPAADQAKDLLQKLSLDSKNKTNEATDVAKKYGSANNGEVTSAAIPTRDMSLTPLLEFMDGSMCYLPNGFPSTTYYYGGYDGSIEWGEYPRYVNPEGVEMPPPGVYGDMYHHGYGYAPYGPYPSPGSPVPTMGHDGQLYGPQHYQFPAPYYPPTTPASQPLPANQASSAKGNVSTSIAAKQTPVIVDSTKTSSNGVAKGNANGINGSVKHKSSQQKISLNSNSSFARGSLPGGLHPSGYQDPRYGFDAMWSPFPWFDGSMLANGQQRPATSNALSSKTAHANNISSGRNQNLHPLPQVMGMHTPRPSPVMGTSVPGVMNRMYSSTRSYGQNGNAFRSGLGFGSSGYDSRMNGRWGMALDSKYKSRGLSGFFSYKNENLDGLSELNRGPRAGRYQNPKTFGPTVTIAVKGQSLPTVPNAEDPSVAPDRDQYNRQDFLETYAAAKFFVIKSYSEDDIHKSIKYSVWASTPNGNKKLDAAYVEAKERTSRCPVFLFFSVNTSGQFVGVAEMVGPVDFNKTVEYWQQDKWTGCFPVKWHIVKDVPNSIFKHITLENNDNKPVTNSRDTQEVKLDQGLQVLKLFKEHSSNTSILDDFSFYETRQKVMQERKSKQQQHQKKVMDSKSVDSDEMHQDGPNGNSKLQMPLEVTILKKEPGQVLGERLLAEENGMCAVAGLSPKQLKPVTENRVLGNCIANGC